MTTLLAVDIEFPTKKTLQEVCHEVAVAECFEFIVKRSSKTRYEIACKSDNCPWRLYAAPVAGTAHIFRIRAYHNEHNCTGVPHLGNRQVSACFIAKTITQKLVARPD